MSASITARSPLLVVLYEGAGAMPLEPDARFEITRTLLEKGYRVITTRAGRSGTTPGDRQVLVLGRFTGAPPDEAVAGTGAAVHFRSLDGVEPAGVIALVEGVGGDAQTQKPGGWKPWFPVIDYSRCTNCMQCLSFCLFDVYGVSKDKQIEVQKPDQLQDRLPRLLARLPGSRDPLPEVQGRPDQRRRGQRRRPRAREDEGRHLGAARRRHLRGAAPAQRRTPAAASPASATTSGPSRSASAAWPSCSRRSTSRPEVMNALPGADAIRDKAERAARAGARRRRRDR